MKYCYVLSEGRVMYFIWGCSRLANMLGYENEYNKL